MNSGVTGRPPRTSSRYGSTSSRLAGPPYAISRTATRSPAMHPVHDGLHRIHRSLGQHAVSEVEDVTRPPGGAGENVPHASLELGTRGEQGHGVQIPLDGTLAVRTQPLPGDVERNAPVHADHVAPGAREVLERSEEHTSELQSQS